jgi:hypothetical protein
VRETRRRGYLHQVRSSCVLALAIVIAAAPVHAEPQVSTKRRAAAVALVIFPGVLVHGIGAWTVGEKHTAKELLVAEGAGIAVAGLAGLLVGGSGGNPYTVPAVPLVVAGSGLLLQSWFEDIWVAAGGSRVCRPPRALAPWSVELGTSWLHDAYRERALLRGGGRVALGKDGVLGRFELGGIGLVDAGGDSELVQGDARVRILGAAATGEQVDDNTRVTARVGERWHRDKPDDLSQLVTEIAVDGRLDLYPIDHMFGRTFITAGTGVGFVHVRYGDAAKEWSSELLAHFAWGAYLGDRGEASVFYEHTRDGLVGGLPAYRASGFVGSVGAMIDARVYGPWGVRAELDIGNAYLTTLAVSYRGGPR